MITNKQAISDAICSFPMQDTPAFRQQFGSGAELQISSIESGPADLNIHDYLFDGNARVTVRAADGKETVVKARVFGRSDGRRVEVDRVTVAA